jgi:ketosteroid isomerase-like protein
MHFSTSFFALLAFASLPVTSWGDSADKLQEITQLEQVWNEAHVRGDVRALDELWADDLIVMVPGMSPMGKSDTLAFARSGRMAFSRYETSDLRIRHFVDVVIVTGKLFRVRLLAGVPHESGDLTALTRVVIY